MLKRLLIPLLLLNVLIFCSSEPEKIEPTFPEYFSPQFCDNDNLQFIQKEFIGDEELLFYYIYNIPTKELILKRINYAHFFPVQDTQGCSSKYLVYCKCNGTDCGAPSNFKIKDAVTSLNNVHVYTDFNCYAEDIKTGEVKPLLDKLRNDVANNSLVDWVAFEIYGGSTFQTPAVYEDKVILSYLMGDLLPSSDNFTPNLLLVDINNPDDYKAISVNDSALMVSPLFNGEYIITGDLTLYNIQTGDTKKITLSFQTNQNELNSSSPPIYHYFFSEYFQPYSISGDNLVFRKFKTESNEAGINWKVFDIYLYNIKELKEVKIYSNTIDSTSEHPAIWGDKVVWMQARRTGRDKGVNLAETSIMLYNLTTGELREIVPEKPNPLWPTTNGRFIAWLDTEVGDEEKGRSPDVYLYDIETQETWKVSPDD